MGATRDGKETFERIRRVPVACVPFGKSDHLTRRDGERVRVDVFETNFRRRGRFERDVQTNIRVVHRDGVPVERDFVDERDRRRE